MVFCSFKKPDSLSETVIDCEGREHEVSLGYSVYLDADPVNIAHKLQIDLLEGPEVWAFAVVFEEVVVLLKLF